MANDKQDKALNRQWTVLDVIALVCGLGIWLAYFSERLGAWIFTND